MTDPHIPDADAIAIEQIIPPEQPPMDDAAGPQEDIGPDNGKRPPYTTPIDPSLGAVGTGDSYSGQEYDAAGQAEWRAKQARGKVPADGTVIGSGVDAGKPGDGEDFDVDTQTRV